MAFSPEYIRTVLNEAFEDAKVLFLGPLMSIHYAHLVMLTEQGILTPSDAHAIRVALDGLDLDAMRQASYDPSCEDLFFDVDRRLANGCGGDVAGRLHTARSRNDIDMTMYRMSVREGLLTIAEGTLALRRALIDLADRHRESIFPAHTHGQPAQPTTLAHYLLAVIEQLERDTVRLRAAYATVNRCPLGACAITGTAFPICRDRTSALLGFAAPTGNTYGSIASADYLMEAAAAVSVLVAGIGRVVQDLLFWATQEVGFLRLPDGFVQVSSIMPQKRNPVALEHARAIASKAFAEASSLATVLHNTPFGDIVDAEDDVQPLVALMLRDASRAITLLAATMPHAAFDTARMRTRAAEGWTTVTELADTLARDQGLPFAAAHAVVSAVVTRVREEPALDLAGALHEVAREQGYVVHLSSAAIARALDPMEFVTVRRTPGGPAPEITERAIVQSRAILATDTSIVVDARRAVAQARTDLQAAAAAL